MSAVIITQMPVSYTHLDDYANGISYEDWTEKIYQRFDECTEHDWCHTISNAMIVTAALLYGNKDFGKSICLAVQTGFDTDCNGATVGSVVGMISGISKIDTKWTEPVSYTHLSVHLKHIPETLLI